MHRKLTSLFSSSSAHLWFTLSDQSVSVSASSFSSDQHLIIGAEEGIYTMNLNSSETTMELVKKPLVKLFVAKIGCCKAKRRKKCGLCWCTRSEYTDFFSFFQLYPGKCTWVYTISNVLMSISGTSNVGNTNKYWITTEALNFRNDTGAVQIVLTTRQLRSFEESRTKESFWLKQTVAVTPCFCR